MKLVTTHHVIHPASHHMLARGEGQRLTGLWVPAQHFMAVHLINVDALQCGPKRWFGNGRPWSRAASMTKNTSDGWRQPPWSNHKSQSQITNEPWKSEWSMPLGCVNMLSRGRILFNRCYKMHRSVFPQQWRRFSIFDDGCQTLVASLSALSRSRCSPI